MYLLQPSPVIIQALDEAIRSDLQNCRDTYFWWLLFSSAIVALGVIFEGPEVVHETIGVVRRRTRGELERHTPGWIILIGLLGWILVVGGVAGEGIAEAFVSKADGLLQTFNDILLADAQRQSGNAKNSADGAADAATRAQGSADEARGAASGAQERADSVSKEADALAIRIQELNGQVDSLSPRDVVIGNARQDLLKKLSSFAGQRFSAQMCGPLLLPLDPERSETMDTWGSIANLLGAEAKWGWESQHVYWKGCPRYGGGGIFVFVNSDAPPDTMKAARVLSEQLTSVLPDQYSPVLEITRSDHLGQPPIDAEAPWVLVSRDHGLVAVLVEWRPTPMSKAIAKPSAPKKH